MNLANKLTLFRIILIPFFILTMTLPLAHGALLSLVIFALAAITDHLDGRIARTYNLITNFGIFMDPFADKLLVTSAIILLVDHKMVPAWVAIIIIAREFAVSGLRTVAAKEGTVIAASWWGKVKTSLQMVAIILLMIQRTLQTDPWFDGLKLAPAFQTLPQIVLYLAALMTLYSGVDYFIKGWHAIDPNQ